MLKSLTLLLYAFLLGVLSLEYNGPEHAYATQAWLSANNKFHRECNENEHLSKEFCEMWDGFKIFPIVTEPLGSLKNEVRAAEARKRNMTHKEIADMLTLSVDNYGLFVALYGDYFMGRGPMVATMNETTHIAFEKPKYPGWKYQPILGDPWTKDLKQALENLDKSFESLFSNTGSLEADNSIEENKKKLAKQLTISNQDIRGNIVTQNFDGAQFFHGEGGKEYGKNMAKYAGASSGLLSQVTGEMVEMAAYNFDHFGIQGRASYALAHWKALSMSCLAGEAQAVNHLSSQSHQPFSATYAQNLVTKAVAMNGLADHFLTDLFSAGHLRTPRKQIADLELSVLMEAAEEKGMKLEEVVGGDKYDWWVSRKIMDWIREKTGLQDVLSRRFKLAGLWAANMHNEDNAAGLFVKSRKKPEGWVAFGDSEMFTAKNNENREELLQAVEASLNDLMKMSQKCYETTLNDSGISLGAAFKKVAPKQFAAVTRHHLHNNPIPLEKLYDPEFLHDIEDAWVETLGEKGYHGPLAHIPNLDQLLRNFQDGADDPNPFPMFAVKNGKVMSRAKYHLRSHNYHFDYSSYSRSWKSEAGLLDGVRTASAKPLVLAPPLISAEHKLNACMQLFGAFTSDDPDTVKCNRVCGMRNDPETGGITSDKCHDPTFFQFLDEYHAKHVAREDSGTTRRLEIENALSRIQPSYSKQPKGCDCAWFTEEKNKDEQDAEGTCLSKKKTKWRSRDEDDLGKIMVDFCASSSSIPHKKFDCCRDSDVKQVFNKMEDRNYKRDGSFMHKVGEAFKSF